MKQDKKTKKTPKVKQMIMANAVAKTNAEIAILVQEDIRKAREQIRKK